MVPCHGLLQHQTFIVHLLERFVTLILHVFVDFSVGFSVDSVGDVHILIIHQAGLYLELLSINGFLHVGDLVVDFEGWRGESELGDDILHEKNMYVKILGEAKLRIQSLEVNMRKSKLDYVEDIVHFVVFGQLVHGFPFIIKN